MNPLRIQKMSDIRRHVNREATPECLPNSPESRGDGLDSVSRSGPNAVMSMGNRRNAIVRTRYLTDIFLDPNPEG